MERVIFHCDLNSFYASVELLDHPELRHLPVAVCGDQASRHGIILAKNEPAKRCGVRTAETIWQAKQKCPQLQLLSAHQEKYQRWSQRINALYEEYTDLVEPFGIDESWLDVSGTLHLFGGDGAVLADELRDRIRREMGLTISVGVSFNKIFAKLGSDFKKPDATTVITRENHRDLVWPLPVTDLLYVGRSSSATLGKFGIRTIGQLAQFDRQALYTLLGKLGAQLHDYANGLDRAPVAPVDRYTPPKSVGNGLTFPRDLVGEEEVRSGITMLADRVAARLRRHGMQCMGVQLSIRDPNFHDLGRQKKLALPTCLAREIGGAAMELALANWNLRAPVRALTITAIDLVSADQVVQQLDLLGETDAVQRQRLERRDRAVDAIRAKYGRGSIRPASAQQSQKESGHPVPQGGAPREGEQPRAGDGPSHPPVGPARPH